LLFSLYPLRFEFIAQDAVCFPPGMSSNILRGAFGTVFRSVACLPECTGAQSCNSRAHCAYAQVFEPSAIDSGPSGFANWPRPFVFRTAHLNGVTISPQAVFYFDLNLFTVRKPTILDALVQTFARLADEGLGPNRGRVQLVRVLRIGENHEPVAVIFHQRCSVVQHAAPLEIDLTADTEPVSRVVVRFVTPTELKSGDQIALQPDFGILATRIRDRISNLREFYGCGPLDVDFRGFGERAGRIRLIGYNIEHQEITRRSSRTGQTHPLGGFTGEAEYEGDLTEFVPYLRAAKWTGVGRQTVWGKGEITCECARLPQ
jgi:hypothetical protein